MQMLRHHFYQMCLVANILWGQIRHLKKEKAVKFLVGKDIGKVNCMKWTGADIKDLISPKVHLKTSITGVTLPLHCMKASAQNVIVALQHCYRLYYTVRDKFQRFLYF